MVEWLWNWLSGNCNFDALKIHSFSNENFVSTLRITHTTLRKIWVIRNSNICVLVVETTLDVKNRIFANVSARKLSHYNWLRLMVVLEIVLDCEKLSFCKWVLLKKLFHFSLQNIKATHWQFSVQYGTTLNLFSGNYIIYHRVMIFFIFSG